jgi:hypothetical protein
MEVGQWATHINEISDELKHVGQFEEVEKWLNLISWTMNEHFRIP